MKVVKKLILFVVLSVILQFSSCNNGENEKDNKNLSDEIPQKEISKDDTIIIESDKSEKNIDLDRLKYDLDTFALLVKKTHLPFELKTDTIGDNSSNNELWAFKNGMFKIINPDSTKLLVRHYFFIPKTERILRIYLLELTYSNIAESGAFFKKLIDRKSDKAYLTDECYMNYGLTGTTDYVIKIEETILWFNISCQYSKKEFKQLIEIFKKSIQLTNKVEVIKCFCSEGCE